MNELVDAFKALLVAASEPPDNLARTAKFSLDNVNWEETPIKHNPARQPVVDTHLEAACTCSGDSGSTTQRLARAVLTATDQLEWRTSARDDEGPDVAIFSRSFAATTIIGAGGLLPSDIVSAGLSLQGRDIYYPPHAHRAEESYWIIGGNGDWKVDTQPWFAVGPGDCVYHKPWARHAMQTNEQPLLSVWLWTSHLDSEVVIVRG